MAGRGGPRRAAMTIRGTDAGPEPEASRGRAGHQGGGAVTRSGQPGPGRPRSPGACASCGVGVWRAYRTSS